MARKTVYCEIEFLLDFFKNKPIINNNDDDYTSVEKWRNYKDIFFKNANIYLDISADKFSQTDHPFINELKKKKGDGEIKLKFDKFFTDDLKDIDSHSLFFLANDDRCKQMEEEYGMLFISNKNYSTLSDVLFSPITFHSIGRDTDWSIMQAHKHPCNTIHLIDNYVFSKPKDVVKSNLTTLFQALMPERLKTSFSLTIYTKEPDKNKFSDEDVKQYRENCLLTEQIVKSINPKYDVSFKVVPVHYSQHDRCIITNYYLFDCGYGFTLTANEKAKGTRIHINRITQPGVLEAITELESNIKRL